jgi:hypothetical protein
MKEWGELRCEKMYLLIRLLSCILHLLWVSCQAFPLSLVVTVTLFFWVFHWCLPPNHFSPPRTPPPPASLWAFMADISMCFWVHGVLLLISCLFFMMFQLIHHIPCALEWNSTHTNPWRLKKSSQGIFCLFVYICTFNQASVHCLTG